MESCLKKISRLVCSVVVWLAAHSGSHRRSRESFNVSDTGVQRYLAASASWVSLNDILRCASSGIADCIDGKLLVLDVLCDAVPGTLLVACCFGLLPVTLGENCQLGAFHSK